MIIIDSCHEHVTDIEVSHDNVVTTGVHKLLKSERKMGRTRRDREDVDVDGDIVDNGYYEEVLVNRIIRKKVSVGKWV